MRDELGTSRVVIGWDVGGAHVKACLLEDGRVRDVAQWPCPLWQGLEHLHAVLHAARKRWPQMESPATRHAATMTGEMVDLFANREEGVRRLVAELHGRLGATLRLYAGEHGWVEAGAVASHWHAIASANWRATAELVARRLPEAVLLDIGSTTTDVIPIRDGRVATRGTLDAERLATGELVYQGVVRTPLCALAPRMIFEGRLTNVMNEFFATTADVYRLTGELDAEHDQQTPADNGGKDAAATRQRLARMIGRDARDATEHQWLELAQGWRARQLQEIGGQLDRVITESGLGAQAPIVSAGCGDFLARELAARSGRRYLSFGSDIVPMAESAADLAHWNQVCAPAVAVAMLVAQD